MSKCEDAPLKSRQIVEVIRLFDTSNTTPVKALSFIVQLQGQLKVLVNLDPNARQGIPKIAVSLAQEDGLYVHRSDILPGRLSEML